MIRAIFFWTGLLSAQVTAAQLFSPTHYPQGYFRDPLDIPIRLAGDFGEMRPNHYHMGLDIKTEHRIGLPVHAAADGYIARIKIEPEGFGRAIYVNHPNGLTTVYGHLHIFNPRLEAWVTAQQYRLESWQVYLDVPPDLFPVKKGDLLAYSGTTGGSQAPHVHFEIRRTADDVNLNPLLFGLPVTDHTRPRILRLAVYDRTKSVYEQSPRILPVRESGSAYVLASSLITVKDPKISFAISTFDTQSGTPNLNGVFEADLYADDRPVIGFRMDQISYTDTRNINAHIDYKTREQGGPYLQQLSELPGYIHSIYKKVNGNGVLDIGDGKIHPIRIEVRDAYGNTSVLAFKVQYQEEAATDSEAAGKLFYPLMLDGYEGADCEFYIGDSCLYDSAHIQYSQKPSALPEVVSAVHSIGAPYIPLEEPFLVRIRPNRGLTPEEQQHTVMQWFSGRGKAVAKPEWKDNWASARFPAFGSFQLVVDTVPPVSTPLGFTNGSRLDHASRIAFTVKDNLGAYQKVRAELDGKWLRFTNDKGRAFIYEFDERCPSGPHDLRIRAEDEAGNIAEKTIHFTR